MTTNTQTRRCRRCGAMPSSTAAALDWHAHVGPHGATVLFCVPCAADLMTPDRREEYLRLSLLAA